VIFAFKTGCKHVGEIDPRSQAVENIGQKGVGVLCMGNFIILYVNMNTNTK